MQPCMCGPLFRVHIPNQQKMKKFSYETPTVEYFDVLVEQGFAASQLDSDFEEGGEDAGTWE